MIIWLFAKFILLLIFADAESQACSSRDLLLIMSFPIIIIPIITSALLGKMLHMSGFTASSVLNQFTHMSEGSI